MKKLFATGSGSNILKYADRLGNEVVEVLDDEYGMIAEFNVSTDSLNIEVFAESEDDFPFYTYVQPLDEITPNDADLDLDSADLAEAIMNGLYDQEKGQEAKDRTITHEEAEDMLHRTIDDSDIESATEVDSDEDQSWDYKGFTVYAEYVPGSEGPQSDDFYFGILDPDGKEIDLGASGFIDQEGNYVVGIFDRPAIMSEIDRMIDEGYQVESDEVTPEQAEEMMRDEIERNK